MIEQVKTPIFKLVVPVVLVVLAPMIKSLFSFSGKFYSIRFMSLIYTGKIGPRKCNFVLLTLKLPQIQMLVISEGNKA